MTKRTRDRAFLDTNVLVYAAVLGEPRHQTASGLLLTGGVVSVQVLNEFASVGLRKLKWPAPKVVAALGAFRALLSPPLPLTVATHEAALDIAQRDGLSFYDALVVASALEAGCAELLTEDMQDGRVIDGRLRIRNPFPAS